MSYNNNTSRNEISYLKNADSKDKMSYRAVDLFIMIQVSIEKTKLIKKEQKLRKLLSNQSGAEHVRLMFKVDENKKDVILTCIGSSEPFVLY